MTGRDRGSGGDEGRGHRTSPTITAISQTSRARCAARAGQHDGLADDGVSACCCLSDTSGSARPAGRPTAQLLSAVVGLAGAGRHVSPDASEEPASAVEACRWRAVPQRCRARGALRERGRPLDQAGRARAEPAASVTEGVGRRRHAGRAARQSRRRRRAGRLRSRPSPPHRVHPTSPLGQPAECLTARASRLQKAGEPSQRRSPARAGPSPRRAGVHLRTRPACPPRDPGAAGELARAGRQPSRVSGQRARPRQRGLAVGQLRQPWAARRCRRDLHRPLCAVDAPSASSSLPVATSPRPWDHDSAPSSSCAAPADGCWVPSASCAALVAAFWFPRRGS